MTPEQKARAAIDRQLEQFMAIQEDLSGAQR